ncbi:MAG TPA: STAS domain-containing protein [Gammaproteobacteria bacterium]|nr:STAS domain-containing protein [Gammaproteobacteria bacterium]
MSEAAAVIAIDNGKDSALVSGEGEWTINNAAEIKETLVQALATEKPVSMDVTKVTRMDTPVMQLLLSFKQDAKGKGVDIDWQGVNETVRATSDILGMSAQLGF